MEDPITLLMLTAFIVKNAPSWLALLQGTILDKGREVAIDKGKEYTTVKVQHFVSRIFRLDEKEQLRHLEQTLKNATECGLVAFDTLAERDLYKDILRTLSEPGPLGKALRQEIMHLFTLSESPDLASLSDIYNQRQRFYNAAHQDIDASPPAHNACLLDLANWRPFVHPNRMHAQWLELDTHTQAGSRQ